jgi:YggT family protein
MARILLTLVDLVYWFVVILIFARIILSFIRVGSYQLRDLVFRLTEPLLAPIRRLLPPSAGLDFSPMILLLGVWFLRVLVYNIIR